MGLRPIYLRILGELTIDPLYELGSERDIVSAVDDFFNIYNKAIDYDALKLTAEYCKKFYTPIDMPVLRDITINHDL
jgi:hypothetical protein